MTIEEGKDVVMQPDAFPNAVTDEEAAIEYRDLGFVAREKFAIDVNLDGCISLIDQRLMRTLCHPLNLPRSSTRKDFIGRAPLLCSDAVTPLCHDKAMPVAPGIARRTTLTVAVSRQICVLPGRSAQT